MFTSENNRSTDSIIGDGTQSEENLNGSLSVIAGPEQQQIKESVSHQKGTFAESARGLLIRGCCCMPKPSKSSTTKMKLVPDFRSTGDLEKAKKIPWTKSVSDLTMRLKQRCQTSPGTPKKEAIKDEDTKMDDIRVSSSEKAAIFFGKVKSLLRLNTLRRPMSRPSVPVTPRGFENHKCCQHGSYVRGYDPTDGMEFYDNDCFSLDETDTGVSQYHHGRVRQSCEDLGRASKAREIRSVGNSCSQLSVCSAESRGSNGLSLNDIHFDMGNELNEKYRREPHYASCNLCEDYFPSFILDNSLPDDMEEQKPSLALKLKQRLRTKSLPSGLHLQLGLGPPIPDSVILQKEITSMA